MNKIVSVEVWYNGTKYIFFGDNDEDVISKWDEVIKDNKFENGNNKHSDFLHNINGPAIKWTNSDKYDNYKSYYINGKCIPEKDFNIKRNLRLLNKGSNCVLEKK